MRFGQDEPAHLVPRPLQTVSIFMERPITTADPAVLIDKKRDSHFLGIRKRDEPGMSGSGRRRLFFCFRRQVMKELFSSELQPTLDGFTGSCFENRGVLAARFLIGAALRVII